MATPKAYRRRFGDRKEGRQLHSLAPFYKFMPYIMRTRNDACNNFSDSIEISEIDRWLRAKRSEGYKGIGFLHLYIAAYVRTVAMRPGINRFISGQKIYSRNNIQVVLTVKRALTAEATETTIKVELDPRDTVFDIYRKMNEQIDEIKANTGDNNTEQIAGTLCKLPGLFLKFAVWILNIMDYFDLIPASLLRASPFHGSMIVTDMGSLGIPPIYHHLYNFGNLPVFVSFGAKRRVMELDDNGTPVERKYIDCCAVTDERICDGYYYASAFKYLRYFLKNPGLLEELPESVEADVL
jgi:hypothetical protein